MIAFLGSLGAPEIGLILLVLLLLFGAKRLPELARSLGQGIREFRKSVREMSEGGEDAESRTSPKPSDRGPSA